VNEKRRRGCFTYASAAVTGGAVGAAIGIPILTMLDIGFLHPGNPDAGQLGVLGPFIGGPVGLVLGILFVALRGSWRSALGGALCGVLISFFVLFARGADLTVLCIGVPFSGMVGFVAGWLFVRKW